ncbi:hypothetical protein H101_03930 [Trichophyton interdigitale H6]|nr:hypothetical protein H101_03930 [Trichophyton interdigitale H6]
MLRQSEVIATSFQQSVGETSRCMAVVLFPGQTATLDGLVVKLVKKAVGSEVRYVSQGFHDEPSHSLSFQDILIEITEKKRPSRKYQQPKEVEQNRKKFNAMNVNEETCN